MQDHYLEIRIVPAGKLSPGSAEEILALCERAYGEDLWPIIRTFKSSVHIFGTLDDRIVAHVLWITRWLSPAGAPPLRTAYVEAVATEPSHQGRGYASLLMRALIDAVGDFDLAALSASDSGQSLYARLGWRPWRGPLFIRTESGEIATPGEEVMIYQLPGKSPLDTTSPLSAEWREGELW